MKAWGGNLSGLGFTYSLHGSSFLGQPFRILNVDLVRPKGTTMETIGRASGAWGLEVYCDNGLRNLRLGFSKLSEV